MQARFSCPLIDLSLQHRSLSKALEECGSCLIFRNLPISTRRTSICVLNSTQQPAVNQLHPKLEGSCEENVLPRGKDPMGSCSSLGGSTMMPNFLLLILTVLLSSVSKCNAYQLEVDSKNPMKAYGNGTIYDISNLFSYPVNISSTLSP